jgi:Skp family chaperone for outer membrane proteins
LLLLALLGGPARAQTRIGTVDMRKLFYDYYRTIEAQKALDAHAADLEKEHTKMAEDWKKLKQDYQNTLASANDQAISADERDNRKKLAEDKLKQLKKAEDNLADYERQANTTYTEQKNRIHDKVIDEIRAVLEAKARAGGYTLVLDVAALGSTGIPIVIYHNDKDNDLTQAILDELNAAAPREAPKTPQK